MRELLYTGLILIVGMLLGFLGAIEMHAPPSPLAHYDCVPILHDEVR